MNEGEDEGEKLDKGVPWTRSDCLLTAVIR